MSIISWTSPKLRLDLADLNGNSRPSAALAEALRQAAADSPRLAGQAPFEKAA